MYIYPNTDIRILSGVPLNNDYDNVMYFGTLTQQTNYFLGKTKYTLSNQSYQRKERGWLKVNVPQNNLWDCSYLMYRNTSFGTKWFYAFILSVEYVNNETSLINFEIDVMQTWFFDYTLEPCFVEREHSETDELFGNLIDENLDLGNEFSVQLYRRYDLTPDRIAVVYTSIVDKTVDPPELLGVNPRKIGDYFSGVGIISFNMSDTSEGGGWDQLGEFLHSYIDNGFEDAILSIYQVPHFISTLVLDPYNTDTWNISPNFVNIDGYIPKNKKLFNYPYNFLKLSNNKGDDTIFKHEMWDSISHIGEFELRGVGVGIPSVMCYPLYYRDMPKDFENGIMYNGFTECPWVGDAYQIWLAQNRKNNDLATKIGVGALVVGAGLGLAGGALAASGGASLGYLAGTVPTEIGAGSAVLSSGAFGNASLGAVGATTGRTISNLGFNIAKTGGGTLVSAITDKIKAKNTLEATPRPAHGHINNDIFNMQTGICGYTCYQMTVKREFAKIIDEYFSRFGYACHEIKIPNRNARQNWTYTKTVGCEIIASIPVDDAVKIKQIYDHGVTFWNNPNNIGNFGDFTNPTYS